MERAKAYCIFASEQGKSQPHPRTLLYTVCIVSSVLTPEYLTVDEAAKLLRLNPATLYRAVERGELPALRLSEHGAIRIPSSALEVQRPAETRARAGTPSGAVEAGAAARDEGTP